MWSSIRGEKQKETETDDEDKYKEKVHRREVTPIHPFIQFNPHHDSLFSRIMEERATEAFPDGNRMPRRRRTRAS